VNTFIEQIPLSDAMKAKARLTIGGGRDFDNGRVSLSAPEMGRSCFRYPNSPLLQSVDHTTHFHFRSQPRSRGEDSSDFHPFIFIIREF
jgi:hypothetical protein